MGMGKSAKCSECGVVSSIALGVGMMYPSSCEQLTARVRAGKYGEKYRLAMREHPEALVDADLRLYQCECGYWENDYALDICETEETTMRWSSLEGSARKRRWFKQNGYSCDKVVIKKYDHICPECGRVMRDITDEEGVVLRCKKCHEGELRMRESSCWD